MSRDFSIIFSAPMVLALLGERKTMTRRLAWSAPRKPSSWQAVKPGDRLWVRENVWRYGIWEPYYLGGNEVHHRFKPMREPSDLPDVIYAADASDDVDAAGRRRKPMPGRVRDHLPGWHLRPCIYMQREHSRLTLIVEETKIQPLRSISHRDLKREGIFRWDVRGAGVNGQEFWHYLPPPADFGAWSAASETWKALWIGINGVESWESNPDVAAISFRVIKANIDSQEAKDGISTRGTSSSTQQTRAARKSASA